MEDILILGYDDAKSINGIKIDECALSVKRFKNGKEYLLGVFLGDEANEIYHTLIGDK